MVTTPTASMTTPPSAATSFHPNIVSTSNANGNANVPARTAADENPLTCPLQVGDLVRVSEEGRAFSKRLKDRDHYLGRVKSVVTIHAGDDDNNGNYLLYEVEWVLGGRLTNVRRQDLVRRTAVQEGYTEHRKRSRPTLLDPTEQASSSPSKDVTSARSKAGKASSSSSPMPHSIVAKKPNSGGKASKKSEKAKTQGASSAVSLSSKEAKAKPIHKASPSSGGGAAASNKKTSNKGSSSKKATAATKKPAMSSTDSGKKRKRTSEKQQVGGNWAKNNGGVGAATTGSSSSDLRQQSQLPPDPYESHKREFERILARLEKVDKFGFFLDPAPPQFDECYDPPLTSPPPSSLNHKGHGEAETASVSLETEAAAAKANSNRLPLVPNAPEAPAKTSQFGALDAVVSPLDFLAAAAVAATAPTAANGGNGVTSSIASDPTPSPAPLNGNAAAVEPAKVPLPSSVAAPPPRKKPRKDDDGVRAKKPAPPPLTTHKVIFPDHPPFNWAMVRRRMEHGRYMLDRVEEEAARRKKHRIPGMKRKGIQPLHKRGVHWRLFLEDVNGMCDMALAMDNNDGDGDGDGDGDDENANFDKDGVLDADRRDDGRERGGSSLLPTSPVRLVRGSLAFAVKQIKEAVQSAYERTGVKQMNELSSADDVHKYLAVLEAQSNTEAAMQAWRKIPFPERRYERLGADVVCSGLSPVDERIASYELRTSLPDSFVGLSYRYDDTGQSEAWMKSVVDETGRCGATKPGKDRKGGALEIDARQAAQALAADDGVIAAQVNATMQSLLIAVQDRVMTESGVLHQSELRSANWVNDEGSLSFDSRPELVEKPVWGMDCYTRRNILLCLEADFLSPVPLQFVEKWLLPAINACPDPLAHNIANAARLLEGLPFESTTESAEATTSDRHTLLQEALAKKIRISAPKWLQSAANQLRRAREALGPDFFRVHPKGHGSILLSPVSANSLVTFYRGELYPSWRWGEKMDAIDITQQRKDLKPALPDFYNMILERPQLDPRGYGLLFVDASRKAGHGSSLSHSCDPTCEVRVAALNGELCLAMTTLRELEMGEELTFDYNAVTESLNEYRSAVCLCGYGKCRGSFLHFSTADCYQQVLNRNAPVASRFANLVKGSMKVVMSEDDERVLRSHGFLTAAFGPISVNRRQALECDSLDFVPVWLRTYVADTLRYIEYERRALPISLICDHLSSMEGNVEKSGPVDRPSREPTKPEPSFFFFTRTQADFVNSLMKKEGIPESLSGLQRRQAFNKVAANFWQTLPEEKKEYWKQQSVQDFEKRLRAWKGSKSSTDGSKGSKKLKKKRPAIDEMLRASKLTFQDADAEGISAMEQRIQQLTQSLSRVGRVLDRHCECSLKDELVSAGETDTASRPLRDRVHAPICIISDAAVIGWIWNSNGGVLQPLLAAVTRAKWARPILLEKLCNIQAKYPDLEAFGDPTGSLSIKLDDLTSAPKARDRLRSALYEIRRIMLSEVKEMGKVFKLQKSLLRQEAEKEATTDADEGSDVDMVDDSALESCEEDVVAVVACDQQVSRPEGESRSFVSALDPSLVDVATDQRRDEQASRSGSCPPESHTPQMKNETRPAIVTKEATSTADGLLEANPWLEHYSDRCILLAVADLLLFYAQTTNFFLIQSYKPLRSTPIEVYARELGNAVPRSAMDSGSRSSEGSRDQPKSIETVSEAKVSEASDRSPKLTQPDLCEPDDIIAEVSVEYRGDFVLSQLLQWYNGGIGLKPGLPDMIGCVLLPSVAGCLSAELAKSRRVKTGKTTYETKTRPRLIEWLQDPYQRGGPWPTDVQKVFAGSETYSMTSDTPALWRPFGSPILDFLVTGDESNIQAVLSHLDADDKVAAKTNQGGLLQSVDKGRPAQAVSNWVQCENPNCMKWRKIPWHVDVDLLPEKFFCKDNIWDPNANSCGAPEDDWDEDDKLVGGDGKVEGSPVRKDRNASLSPMDEANFFIGARFDVLRHGRNRFTIGAVSKVDLSGKVKRIMFRFRRCKDSDEWIEFGSHRIAPLYSKVPRSGSKGKGPKDSLREGFQESVKSTKPTESAPSITGTRPASAPKQAAKSSTQAHKRGTLSSSSLPFTSTPGFESVLDADKLEEKSSFTEQIDQITAGAALKHDANSTINTDDFGVGTKRHVAGSKFTNGTSSLLRAADESDSVRHEADAVKRCRMVELSGREGDQANSQGLSARSSTPSDSREEDALAAMMSLASGAGPSSGGDVSIWRTKPVINHQQHPLWEQPGCSLDAAYFPQRFPESGIREYVAFDQLHAEQRQQQYHQQQYPPLNSFLRELAVREQQQRVILGANSYLGQQSMIGIGNPVSTSQPFSDPHALAQMMIQMNPTTSSSQGDSSGQGFPQQNPG